LEEGGREGGDRGKKSRRGKNREKLKCVSGKGETRGGGRDGGREEDNCV